MGTAERQALYNPTRAVGPSRTCAGLTAHSGLALGQHAQVDSGTGDPPGYRDPTPREIWERRIELHETRGEDAIADELRRRGPPGLDIDTGRQADEADEPGLTPISYMAIHPRTKEVLDRQGVLYAGELCGWTPARLLRLPTIGPKSLAEMRAAMAALGLRLRGDAPRTRCQPPTRHGLGPWARRSGVA